MNQARYEKLQLPALALAHFTADMLGGILPGILPVVRSHFGLSVGGGVLLLSIMGIGSNVFQVPAGMIRRQATLPFMMKIGLATASLIAVAFLLPAATPMIFIAGLMLIIGIGIAFVHPEGLRGVLAVGGRASPVNTSVFMISGFFGFAAGPLVGALLVENFGLAGLLGLLPLPFLVIQLLSFAKVRLAVKTGDDETASRKADAPWTFRELFVIAVFLNAGTAMFQGLLPSFLNEKGFSLTFGGGSTMIFGVGSAAGSLLLGHLARRRRPSRLLIAALAAGLPLLIAYLLLSDRRTAALLAFPAGMLLSAGFPLIVAMAHSAPGKLALGTRMGMIVGGSWAVATAIFLLAGQAADRIGLPGTMSLIPLSYASALACAIGFRLSERGGRG